MEKKTIIIDTLGSDKGPKDIILGAIDLLSKHQDINITLVGESNFIIPLIRELNGDLNRINIIDTQEVVTNYEIPTKAIYEKPNASLFLAQKELANDNNAIGLITAGASGALLAGSIKFLLKDIHHRPCLASLLPTAIKDKYLCLLDCGANIDCASSLLKYFACEGNEFYKKLYKKDNPVIALLSNGRESAKGNKVVKETYPLLLEEFKDHFYGNIEGSDALNGDIDVLVSDGFYGNIFLKTLEGTAKLLIKDLMSEAIKEDNKTYYESGKYLINNYDLTSLGGAIVLGIKKPIIKCHGAANRNSIINTGEILLNLANNNEFFQKKGNK